ncbi:protein FAM131C isoform X2 [Brienomyrus brachyistius]|uniref:protein FAM131C isoform X2 n=1 Tax=Brienomyrus brachyistius TaxID=42636 RepID=UPI0020B25FE9|nr:protein FAM131C isoform X2 [Brienomyrus brachyistius]
MSGVHLHFVCDLGPAFLYDWLQSATEPHVTDPQCADGKPVLKGAQEPANGILSEEKSRGSNYNIGELATSSLLGLVATIKEHITKPTAMAQGRVAHLIEWKALGGGGSAQRGAGWDRARGGWGGSLAGLQEDEQFYSDLSDEVKEARFAAGVAQQFALAEAALSAWSAPDATNGSNGCSGLLRDADTVVLSQYVLDSSGLAAPLPRYSEGGPLFPPQLPSSHWQPDLELVARTRKASRPDGSIRYADSSSMSEDEVFYN